MPQWWRIGSIDLKHVTAWLGAGAILVPQSTVRQSRSRTQRPISSRSKGSAMKGALTTLFSGTFLKGAALSFSALVITAAFAFKQYCDGLIAIRPFTVMEDASRSGISATALADQTK